MNPIDLNALGFRNTERRPTVRERNDADRKRLRDPTPAEWRARLGADERKLDSDTARGWAEAERMRHDTHTD